jgi:hypothetical protein
VLPLTGLQPQEQIVALAIRPANGVVYGLGSSSRLYAIDTHTGATMPILPGGSNAPFSVALSGTSFGCGFNPATDTLRVVSNTGQNLRIHPDTGAVVGVDMPVPPSVAVVGVAHTNSIAGASISTLFAIDATTASLVILSSPDTPTVVPIGPLGVPLSSLQVGFDIRFNLRDACNQAFATIFANGTSGLYCIDLVTGCAHFVGPIACNRILRALALCSPAF